LGLKKNNSTEAGLVERLVREIGVTESQARQLIALLGTDWGSLAREAKILLRRPGHDR
jgi:hypothetical protein